jgi:DNA-binding NarL/FixJ family response regulator
VIRVVLADDQALVRGGFRSILSGQPDIEVVAEAADGQEAIDAVAATGADVALMDVRMPGVDGIEATRRIVARPDARTRVLVLTTFDDDETVYEAFRAGAAGFLVKSAPPRELAAAIRTVAAGDALLAPSVTRRLIEAYVHQPRPGASAPPAIAALTPRESDVLRLIARGHSNAEIGHELFLSEPTVKTHVTRLLAKLQLRDRVQAVVFAYESGFVRAGGPMEAGP